MVKRPDLFLDFASRNIAANSRDRRTITVCVALLYSGDRAIDLYKVLYNADPSASIYQSVIIGLSKAVELKIKSINLFAPSASIVHVLSQLLATPASAPPYNDPLCEQIRALILQFKQCNFIDNSQTRMRVQELRDLCNQAVQCALQFEYDLSNPQPPFELTSPPIEEPLDSNVQESVNRLNKLGEFAKFKDFAVLKSGRDRFSKMNLVQLGNTIPQSMTEIDELWARSFSASALEQYTLSDSMRASIYRWILRGLRAELAIRKVKTDREISLNSTRGK